MNMVYILKCADNTYYTGWSNQFEKRLQAHQQGKGAKYTRGRLPVACVYQREFATKRQAQQHEYQLKQQSRQQKQSLIDDYRQLIHLGTAKCQQFKLKVDAISLIRSKSGIVLYRAKSGDRHLVLKLFVSGFGRGEIACYHFFHQQKLQTLPLVFADDNALVMEDLLFSKEYRLATEDDMNDPAVMESLGQWYRQLHQLPTEPFEISPEFHALRTENLAAKQLQYQDDARFQNVLPHLLALLAACKRLPLVPCYNDFYYVNMAKTADAAFLFDYGQVALNYAGLDLVNALWFSNPESRAAFLRGYDMQIDDKLTEQLHLLQAFFLRDDTSIFSYDFTKAGK